MKEIPGFAGYFACENGHIYSQWMPGAARRVDLSRQPKKLSPAIGTDGYLHLAIKRTGDARCMSQLVHRIICLTFHGECAPGYECSHVDGNKHNNVPANLRWESRSLNHRRKRSHGTHDAGWRNTRALLTEAQVKNIRVLLTEDKLTHQTIGERFGVSRACISKIKGRYRYA